MDFKELGPTLTKYKKGIFIFVESIPPFLSYPAIAPDRQPGTSPAGKDCQLTVDIPGLPHL